MYYKGENPLKGFLVKKHSNFYYVKNNLNVLYECMLRERLKKEDVEVLVGDIVAIDEVNEETRQAVITRIYPRKTCITRPHLANMEQNVIIMALNKPRLNLNQLDRFLVHTRLSGLDRVICINKCDLKDKNNTLKTIREIYEPLEISIIEVSALNKTGLERLLDVLKGKRSIFSGPSGVGKSTILNAIKPELNLRVGKIGSKSNKGTHTTRHSELIEIFSENDQIAIVADTPGFSYLKFDKYLPAQIEAQFPEFLSFKNDCYYSDCLHINETDCNVKANLDKISPTRYENYCRFIAEALEYKSLLYSTSSKDEGKVKTVDRSGQEQVKRLKLGHNLVDPSRKKSKQDLSKYKYDESFEEDIDDNFCE
jgi:ribosome biogenesis GTPase